MSGERNKQLIPGWLKNHAWCKENFDFSNSKFLGKGSFNEVISGYHLIQQKEMALKLLSASDFNDVYLLMEVILKVRNLSHPNILKIYDYFPEAVSDSNEKISYNILLAVELGSSSMNDYLKKNGALTNEQLTKVFHTLHSALTYAHERKIVHSDFKLANILIVQEGCLNSWKINGWKRSLMKTQAVTTTFNSNIITSTLEIRKHLGQIPEEIEIDYVYSLGLILLNCCGIPLGENQAFSDIKEIHDKQIEKLIDEIIDKDVYSSRTIYTIKKMLRFEPERRSEFYADESDIRYKKVII